MTAERWSGTLGRGRRGNEFARHESAPGSGPQRGNSMNLKASRTRELKEDRILRATARLLAKHGFQGTRMEDIAKEAGVPRPNLYYYFPSRNHIYRRIIEDLRREWVNALEQITPEGEPAAVIRDYIRAKIEYSRKYPAASKIFADEVIRGSGILTTAENEEIKRLTDDKCAVIERWMDEGRMDRVDTRHVFFLVWCATQYYADFEQQIKNVLGVKRLTRAHFDTAADTIARIVLKGCGL